jgi:hypothetical protein
VLTTASNLRPDLVFFWRPTHIEVKTILKLSKLGIKTVSYNNDDPFKHENNKKNLWHLKIFWYFYLNCIPAFDRNFFFRKINCQEALKKKAKHADILMPYFIPNKDRPIKLTAEELLLFECDVVFVGHYEEDGRENFIKFLLKHDINLKIWGSNWNSLSLKNNYNQLLLIKKVAFNDYAKAICGAKICLVFLSKLNRDNYTRRCFEIPACGRLMLAERTQDLMNMFKENVEACFFSSEQELLSKVTWLLKNPDIRSKIAEAGMKRVWKDKHDVESRAKEMINKLQS